MSGGRGVRDLAASIEFFDRLPDTAEVDVRTVAFVMGVSVATIWRRAKLGIFPAPLPVLPGTNATRWRVGEVRRSREVQSAPPPNQPSINALSKTLCAAVLRFHGGNAKAMPKELYKAWSELRAALSKVEA